MRELFGKTIFTTIEEMIEPSSTALLIIDMQNDWASDEGFCHKKGISIDMVKSAINKLAKLIPVLRQHRVMVIYTRNITRMANGLCLESPAHLAFMFSPGHASGGGGVINTEDSWGTQIVDALRPEKEDVIITKNRSSAFYGTSLDSLLRSNSIKTLLISGCSTEGCVESTVREAEYHDYFAVPIRDCISSLNPNLHAAAFKVIESRWLVVDCKRILEILSSSAISE